MSTQDKINRDWAFDVATKRAAESHTDYAIWQDAKRGTYMVMPAERGSPYPGTWNYIETVRGIVS